MPAARSWTRRKSSLGLVSVPPAKAGIYGVHTEPNRLTFCPNVTPTTFKAEADEDDMYDDSPADDSAAIFPPSSAPAPPPRRRRAPPGKRRSLGYIPRPPNAFMLFRADFVKQKHVPNSIETNHSSLSKIIGSCWRSLPAEEKVIWEKRARAEKAEHKRKYPEYRFRPVHNKNKNKNADVPPPNKKTKADALPPSLASIEALRSEREGFIAQCLLDGLKGDALKEQVSNWDDLHGWVEGAEGLAMLEARARTPKANALPGSFPATHAVPLSKYPSRRPSSVPLPNDFISFQTGYLQPQQYFSQYADTTFPHVSESSQGLSMDLASYSGTNFAQPSFAMLPPLNNNPLRPPSPSPNNFDVGSISRQQRMVLGGRRASSAQAFINYGRPDDSWPAPHSNWPDMQGHWNWQAGYVPTGTSPSSSASSLPLQTETEELPEADTSLFQPGFAFGASTIPIAQPQPSPFETQQQCNPFGGYTMEQQNDLHLVQQFLQDQQNQIHGSHHISLAPLDTNSYAPHDTSPLTTTSSVQSYSPSYSGSPAPSDRGEEFPIHAPQPVHPTSVDDVDLGYPGPESPAQQSMEDVQSQTAASSTLSAPIDPAAAFTDLWKGLSSSGSFAVAMGFPLDSSANHQHTTDEYSYQSALETIHHTAEGVEMHTFVGEHNHHHHHRQAEFQQMYQAQHEQISMAHA